LAASLSACLTTHCLAGVPVEHASANTCTRNTNGLVMSLEAGDFDNVVSGNTIHVAGGVNLGRNLCDGSLCP
jgi:hypothetical protein